MGIEITVDIFLAKVVEKYIPLQLIFDLSLIWQGESQVKIYAVNFPEEKRSLRKKFFFSQKEKKYKGPQKQKVM